MTLKKQQAEVISLLFLLPTLVTAPTCEVSIRARMNVYSSTKVIGVYTFYSFFSRARFLAANSAAEVEPEDDAGGWGGVGGRGGVTTGGGVSGLGGVTGRVTMGGGAS